MRITGALLLALLMALVPLAEQVNTIGIALRLRRKDELPVVVAVTKAGKLAANRAAIKVGY